MRDRNRELVAYAYIHEYRNGCLNLSWLGLTEIPLELPHDLVELKCDHNMLTSLPPLPPRLKQLDCYENYLISLPPLPSGLERLHCGMNRITKLPTLPSTLTSLFCQLNPLTIIPSLPSELGVLDCNSITDLTSLPPLPSKLTHLYCNNTPITTLPKLPSSLAQLYCSNTNITNLPELPRNVKCLDVYGCKHLKTLPESILSITFIRMGLNPLIPVTNPSEVYNDWIVRINEQTRCQKRCHMIAEELLSHPR